MDMMYRTGPSPLMEVLYCTGSFEFKPHIHDRYVVWINTGAGEQYTIKGTTSILERQSICILEPGLVHSNHGCSSEERGLRSFYVDPAFFEDPEVSMGLSFSPDFFSRQVLRDPGAWDRLALLHARMISAPPDLAMDTLLLDAFSALSGSGSRSGTVAGADPCDRRVNQVIDYFHAHPDTPVRLGDLAQLAGCTQFHLIRLFRRHTGLSPHAFLIQIRLENARHRISRGEQIAAAALAAGFSDQSHLTRAFKARYGLPPKAYQAGLG